MAQTIKARADWQQNIEHLKIQMMAKSRPDYTVAAITGNDGGFNLELTSNAIMNCSSDYLQCYVGPRNGALVISDNGDTLSHHRHFWDEEDLPDGDAEEWFNWPGPGAAWFEKQAAMLKAKISEDHYGELTIKLPIDADPKKIARAVRDMFTLASFFDSILHYETVK